MAALAVDIDGNRIITGVHDASPSLPYQGNAYILKSNPDGELLWADDLFGSVIIGDMATVGSDILIIGQSTGAFLYRGEQYGQGQFFMFVIMLDADGNYKWHFTEQSKWGVNTNIAVGNTGSIALHIRGQSNLGDWIMIIDAEGNEIKSRQISATHTLVVDMAYFNDRVFFNGGFFGPGSIFVDTIQIELPPVENASITMGFDENLTAQWLYVDQTINNRDGRIVADSSGVFVYESVIEANFTSHHSLKKFDFDGALLVEAEAPFFSPFATTYPDMAISPDLIGLFAQNNFSFSSHKVMLFDHDFNLVAEKEISGPSHLYSGQIATYGDDFYAAHVFSGNLNFDDEITLPYIGTGKLPYISRIGSSPVTDINTSFFRSADVQIYPNPADEFITIHVADHQLGIAGNFILTDLTGNVVLKGILNNSQTSVDVGNLSAGMYALQLFIDDGETLTRKIIVR